MKAQQRVIGFFTYYVNEKSTMIIRVFHRLSNWLSKQETCPYRNGSLFYLKFALHSFTFYVIQSMPRPPKKILVSSVGSLEYQYLLKWPIPYQYILIKHAPTSKYKLLVQEAEIIHAMILIYALHKNMLFAQLVLN